MPVLPLYLLIFQWGAGEIASQYYMYGWFYVFAVFLFMATALWKLSSTVSMYNWHWGGNFSKQVVRYS